MMLNSNDRDRTVLYNSSKSFALHFTVSSDLTLTEFYALSKYKKKHNFVHFFNFRIGSLVVVVVSVSGYRWLAFYFVS